MSRFREMLKRWAPTVVRVFPSAKTFGLLFAVVVCALTWTVHALSTLEKAVEFGAFACCATSGVLALVGGRQQESLDVSLFNITAGGLLCFAVALFLQFQFPASGTALAALVVLAMAALAATLVAFLALTSIERHPLQEGGKEFLTVSKLAILMSALVIAWLAFAAQLLG